MPITPTTAQGLRQYDRFPAAEAAVLAWDNPGPRPAWHRAMKEEVRNAMPLLARALDRLVGEVNRIDL
jgi:hypothetical protein